MYKVFIASLLVTLVSSVCLDTTTCGAHGKFLQDGDSYVCLCDNGYSGVSCETFDPCVFAYVLNGGTCVGNPDGTVTVTCPPNTYGARCENFVNQCELTSGLCQHGSTCLPYPAGSFTCECASGYTGTNCQTMVCPEGYTGENCDVDVDECVATEYPLCQNGGTCVNTPGAWSCTCPEGYTGSNCAYGPGGEEGLMKFKRRFNRV